jgi:hypothetical protein
MSADCATATHHQVAPERSAGYRSWSRQRVREWRVRQGKVANELRFRTCASICVSSVTRDGACLILCARLQLMNSSYVERHRRRKAVTRFAIPLLDCVHTTNAVMTQDRHLRSAHACHRHPPIWRNDVHEGNASTRARVAASAVWLVADVYAWVGARDECVPPPCEGVGLSPCPWFARPELRTQAV